MESLDHPVLSEEVARFLEDEGLLTPITDNKRKLSTLILSPPRLLASQCGCTDQQVSLESFEASSVRQEAETVEIPAYLWSKETYGFLGFNDETAARLWERFVNRSADVPISFLDFAVSQIENNGTPDASTASDDWDFCLRACGINEKLRTAILLPEFEDLRYTDSCKHWVIDAMEGKYEALQEMDERVRLEVAHLQRAKEVGASMTQ